MTDIVERLRALKTGGMLPVITEAAAEIERLNADLKKYGDGQVEAWAARDQYMESNVKLVAEIARLQATLAPFADYAQMKDETALTAERLRGLQTEIEQLREAMREIRAEITAVSADVRAVFHERPKLYKAIVQIDAIALEAK